MTTPFDLTGQIAIVNEVFSPSAAEIDQATRVVSAYETVGPIAAEWIAGSETRRAAARAMLEPIVAALEAL